jgi:tetratricopeptide (TPR) repeat protein
LDEQSHETVIVFNKNPRVGLFLVFIFTLCIVVALAAAYSVSSRYIAGTAYLHASEALKVNRITDAEKYLQTAMTFDPSDRVYRLAALTGVASMNQLAGNTTLPPDELQSQFQVLLTQSIEFALAATQENPRNYENYITLAAVYQSVVPLRVDGAYEKALEAYDQAITLNPSSPATRVLLAQLELSRNDLERAESRLLEAIGLKRNYLQAVLLLARLKIETGDSAEALEATERALVIAKADEISLFQIAIYKLGAGDIKNANSLFTRITEINPQYANAHYFIGVTYALLGEYEKAISALSRVGTLAPENAESVAADIASLNDGINPFTVSKLRELGVPGVAPAPAEAVVEE